MGVVFLFQPKVSISLNQYRARWCSDTGLMLFGTKYISFCLISHRCFPFVKSGGPIGGSGTNNTHPRNIAVSIDPIYPCKALQSRLMLAVWHPAVFISPIQTTFLAGHVHGGQSVSAAMNGCSHHQKLFSNCSCSLPTIPSRRFLGHFAPGYPQYHPGYSSCLFPGFSFSFGFPYLAGQSTAFPHTPPCRLIQALRSKQSPSSWLLHRQRTLWLQRYCFLGLWLRSGSGLRAAD